MVLVGMKSEEHAGHTCLTLNLLTQSYWSGVVSGVGKINKIFNYTDIYYIFFVLL